MNPKTFSKKQKNYYDIFPENRDFYLLDSYEKIKDFRATNFEDHEYIYVISESSEGIKENIYKRSDFLNDYEFIKAIEKNRNVSLNFIISKKPINIGGRETRLLTGIKSRKKLMKEIERNTKINFNTNKNVIFKESFSVPAELKFYNRIFTFYIIEPDYNNISNNQNMININNNNNYNNLNQPNYLSNMNNNLNSSNFNFNQVHDFNQYIIPNNNMNIPLNNAFNPNIYKNKEDRKGHTGFL